MNSDDFLADLGPRYSERQLLHAALTILGCSAEELSSRIAAEFDVTASAASGQEEDDVSTSTTSTHSLSGNDTSAYQTDDDDESLDSLLDNVVAEYQNNPHETIPTEKSDCLNSWSANRATDSSNHFDAQDSDGQAQSWLPAVEDLLAPTTASIDGHDGTLRFASNRACPSTSHISQPRPVTVSQPFLDGQELQLYRPFPPLSSTQSTAELSLRGIGDLHQDYIGQQQPPSRLETPLAGPNAVGGNRPAHGSFDASLRGSPIDENNLRACKDAHCVGPASCTDSSSGRSRKKPRLETQTDTTDWSTAPVTPIFTPDAQDPAALCAPKRSNKACLRCRTQHLKCEADPSDPNGPCLRCKELKRSTLLKQQCWPIILGEAHLYREQHAPNVFHTLRWSSMSMKNIDTWASDEIKVINVGHVAMNKFYQLKVREYIPQDGDVLDEQWVVDGVTTYHRIPPYAIADMDEAAEMFEGYVKESVDAYIEAFVGKENPLFYNTYKMACRHRDTAATPEERKLLRTALQLWVCSRKTSNPERIYGHERLGVQNATDAGSPWLNTSPIPPMMIAQMQCIFYTKFLRPLKKEVLDGLWNVFKKQRKSWFTIYLTMFILLHSCSMITRRNQEFARACGLTCRFVNPRAIIDYQEGCNILLSHFHYINKGVSPFRLAANSQTFRKFIEDASLNQEQAHFIMGTALWVQQNESSMLQKRSDLEFEHDLYWVSQLYDTVWRRGPTVSIG